MCDAPHLADMVNYTMKNEIVKITDALLFGMWKNMNMEREERLRRRRE